MQIILKRNPIPMQDDPENDTGGAGVKKRPDADTYAERRGPDGAADRRVFKEQYFKSF
jgi:hypothetical protein